MGLPITKISTGHFSGGRNLAEKGDTDPGERQLDDLIIELQDEVNALGTAAPTAHAASHITGGGDTIADAVAGGAAGLMTGADKTKLDGIEALADVTDAANVGAAGALMDPMTAQGDVIHEGAAGPAALPAGTAGQVLTTGGPAANPAWGDAAAGVFTAGIPADWAAPPPATLQAAVDRIANALATHLAVPIP